MDSDSPNLQQDRYRAEEVIGSIQEKLLPQQNDIALASLFASVGLSPQVESLICCYLGCSFQFIKDACLEMQVTAEQVNGPVSRVGSGAASSLYSSPPCTSSKNSFEALLLIPTLPAQEDSRDE